MKVCILLININIFKRDNILYTNLNQWLTYMYEQYTYILYNMSIILFPKLIKDFLMFKYI